MLSGRRRPRSDRRRVEASLPSTASTGTNPGQVVPAGMGSSSTTRHECGVASRRGQRWAAVPHGHGCSREPKSTAGSLRLRSGQALARLRHTRNDKSYRSGAVGVLLGVERGERYGLVVDGGGMLVDCGGGLGAEIAVAGIEVQSADVVSAVGAGELHAALDASDGVEALHNFQCSLFVAKGKAPWWGSEGNRERKGDSEGDR